METRAGGVRADERERSPRVLLIAHDFPPSSGSGAFRASAFARYLPLYGWRPLVLTVAPPWAPNRDDALLGGVPPELRVIRTRSAEPGPATPPPSPTRAAAHQPALSARARPPKPGALRSQLGHLKRFPDAHLGWLPYALAAALRV